MSDSLARAKTKSKRPEAGGRRAASAGPAADHAGGETAPLGAHYSAGPALSLGKPVQRQLAIGKAGDAHEREAEAAADRVTQGKKVEAGDISKLEPGAIPATSALQKAEAKPEQKVEDKKPVQKAAAKPEEKKPEPKPVQKAEARPEQKVEDKKPVQKAEAKPEQKVEDKKPVQKATAKSEEKKPEPKPVQKAEARPEQKVEDKKPVQKAEAKPEEKKPEPKPVQKVEARPEQKVEDKKPVQKAEARPEQKVEDKKPVQKAAAASEGHAVENEPLPQLDEDYASPVQAKSTGGAGAVGPAAMGSAAEHAIAGKGAGSSLNPATRGALEAGLGADLGHVRVHDDGAAQEAARDLNARAFTHGDDIWLGPGASQSDLHLMAHEATHVVQQSGGVERMVQRAPKSAAGGGGSKGKKNADPPTEPATLEGKTVVVPKLRLPSYPRKADKTPFPLTLAHPKPDRPSDQRQVWAKDIADDADFKSNVTSWLEKSAFPKIKSDKTGKDNYFLRPKGDDKKYLIGDADTLPAKLSTPTWDKSGKYHSFDVDHIREVQLGGLNQADNMELLDSSANRSSGSSINADIQRQTSAATKQLANEGKIPKNVTDIDGLRKNEYRIRFTEKDATYEVVGNPNVFWSRGDVKAGDHLKPLEPLPKERIDDVRGDPTRLVLLNRRGNKLGEIKGWDKSKNGKTENFVPNFDLATVTYQPGKGGKVTGTLFPRRIPLAPKDVEWTIMEEPGIEYGGSIPVALKDLKFNGLSPIEVFEADLDPRGVFVRGVIKPSIPLFHGVEIDFLVEGTDFKLSKTFNTGEFTFPGPIQVTDSSLELSAGTTSGLSVTGTVQFEIQRVGTGTLKGGGSTGKGFEVEGEFTFDKKLFDDAKIKAWYKNDDFGAQGHISIGDGKVRGIKSASIDAAYGAGKLDATGKAELSVPGIKTVNLSMSYAEKDGLALGGSFELADNIPGIQSGGGQAQITQKPDGSGYDVTATGKAVPKIPGISSTINIAYENGAITIEGTAAYDKGMLKGAILVGVTNRPVADGKPSGEPGKTLTLYGGGSVGLQIAPWLQATAGIKLLPNGEIEVVGEIGLPKSLDIFPEKKLDKNIFHIGIDIPIVGVSVAGQRIGIFANITGGLDLSAGIGPGQLREMGLSVSYNPAHEDQTKIHGGAQLHIPAHAGLRLFVRGGLGVGIPIVSAQAGIEIGGQLGLEGALDAGVQVDWSPAKGLKLEALGEIYVEPKFRFDITGFVLVEADLFITTVELYSKKWQLAAFEYGSGLRLGLKFPIKFEEGKPFDISLSDVQFQVPDIEPKALLADLVKQVA